MDSNTDGPTIVATVIVVNQEVIDLVVDEDRRDDTKSGDSKPTVDRSVGALDQASSAAPAPLSIQGAEQQPSSTDEPAVVVEEERKEDSQAPPPPPPKDSGSHPVVGGPSSSSSTVAQIPPPGLIPPPPTAQPPIPPQHTPVLLPSQIVYPVTEITRFKPSPRDVISGIAPHVFDERRRRRSPYSGRQGAGGLSRRSSSSRCRYGYRQGRPRASPLRMSLVISLDDRSIYIEDASSVAARLTVDGKQQHLQLQRSRSDPKLSASPDPRSPSGKKILPWTKFKLDGALFKTLVSRMKRRNPLSKAIQSS